MKVAKASDFKDAYIAANAAVSNIDCAVKNIQDAYGIEWGDGAAYCLEHIADKWPAMPVSERRQALKAWLEFELSLD